MTSFLRLETPEEGTPRRRLLVIQPLVGIGDMVWHKPWIDYLADFYDVILATKPTVQASVLFAETPGVVEILDIDRSQRGQRGQHDGIMGLWRRAARGVANESVDARSGASVARVRGATGQRRRARVRACPCAPGWARSQSDSSHCGVINPHKHGPTKIATLTRLPLTAVAQHGDC